MFARKLKSGLMKFEKLKSESDDRRSSPASYEILTYPADYTLEGLAKKWNDGNIIIPPFQRGFVWKQPQGSKLIESFLLGLPVPPIFLYAQRHDGKFLVIDGQQRLRTIAYFFEGFFGEEENNRRPVFRLIGLNEESPYLNKTYADLASGDEVAFQRLNDAVLRSFVVKQLNPKDDTSIYHIFERLNTGGTFLHAQEIRNCVYHGPFNQLLIELNKLGEWRKILGRSSLDRRQRDVELILRFLALHTDSEHYKKPMKDFLSTFMAHTRDNASEGDLRNLKKIFKSTVSAVHASLGPKPFHIRSGLNIATFDSVFPAFAANSSAIPADIKERFAKLIQDDQYADYTTYRTTDDEVVTARLKSAKKILFGR